MNGMFQHRLRTSLMKNNMHSIESYVFSKFFVSSFIAKCLMSLSMLVNYMSNESVK